MSRKVFITSDISIDERLAEAAEESPDAALLWPWLLTALDDWGRSTAETKRLKYAVFPAFASVTPQIIGEALALFAQVGLITRYEADGKPYFAVPQETWFKYQTHIRTEKRESDRSRIPAPPGSTSPNCAQLRATARDVAQVRAVADKSQPSPSPSPSPSPTHALSPSSPQGGEISDDAANAHAREANTVRASRAQPATVPATVLASAAASPAHLTADQELQREADDALVRWKTLSQQGKARVPAVTALRSTLRKHAERGMNVSDLRTELLKLEDEVASSSAAAGRPLTLTRLDNWLNQWHAPPPDTRPERAVHARASASSLSARPEPPSMIPVSQARPIWGDVPSPLADATADAHAEVHPASAASAAAAPDVLALVTHQAKPQAPPGVPAAVSAGVHARDDASA